jgi:hypothetical protein
MPTPQVGVTDLGERGTSERDDRFLIDQMCRGIYASSSREVNAAPRIFFRLGNQRTHLPGRLGPQFGQVFGNTVYSASIVVAIFMVGLGAGSYLLGALADRRYRSRPDSLVRVYSVLEILIAGLGLLVSLALPHWCRHAKGCGCARRGGGSRHSSASSHPGSASTAS